LEDKGVSLDQALVVKPEGIANLPGLPRKIGRPLILEEIEMVLPGDA
jgi:hypothetical protein